MGAHSVRYVNVFWLDGAEVESDADTDGLGCARASTASRSDRGGNLIEVG